MSEHKSFATYERLNNEITHLRAENEKLREQLRGEIESHQAMTKAYENEIKMLKESREIIRLRDELAVVAARALDTRQKWVSCGEKYSWTPPAAAALIYRLPVVRLVRYFYLACLAECHYLMWRHMGYSARSGYDDWVLFGIFHGYV